MEHQRQSAEVAAGVTERCAGVAVAMRHDRGDVVEELGDVLGHEVDVERRALDELLCEFFLDGPDGAVLEVLEGDLHGLQCGDQLGSELTQAHGGVGVGVVGLEVGHRLGGPESNAEADIGIGHA